MEESKFDRHIYGINDKPPLQSLVLLGLQHLIKFSLLLICPMIIVNSAGASLAVSQQVVSMALIASGITTLLIASRYKFGVGYFIPVQASVPYFAITLISAKLGGMPLVFGTTILLGIFQCGISMLLRFIKPIFDEPTVGFIILMIGLWTALLGVSELFYPGNLGQLMVHEPFLQNKMESGSSLIGYVSLAIMITLRLAGRIRLYSILLGMLAGWILASLCGEILPDRLQLLSESAWIKIPIFSIPEYSFDIRLLFPVFIVALLSSLEVSALITTIQNEAHKNWQAASSRLIRNGNFSAGLCSVFAGLIGTIAQTPIPSSIGDLMITGAYSRYIAYIYGPALILMAFSPKLSMFALTIPAAVNGAAIVFMGAVMMMKGFSMLQFASLKPYHLQAFGISFLLGLSTDMLPDIFPWFTNSALAVGLISYITLRCVFALGQNT